MLAPVRLQVTPRIDESTERALRAVLAEVRSGRQVPAWRRAALRESVERGGYAFSPRRTRGATRA